MLCKHINASIRLSINGNALRQSWGNGFINIAFVFLNEKGDKALRDKESGALN